MNFACATIVAAATLLLTTLASSCEHEVQDEPALLLGSELADHVLIYRDVKEAVLRPDEFDKKLSAGAFAPLAEAVRGAALKEVAVYLTGLPYVVVIVDKKAKRFEAWKVFPTTRPTNVVCRVAIRSTEKGFELGGGIPSTYVGYSLDKKFDVQEFLKNLLEEQGSTRNSDD